MEKVFKLCFPTIALLALTVGCGAVSGKGSSPLAEPSVSASSATAYSNAGPGGCIGSQCDGSQGAATGHAGNEGQSTTSIRVPDVTGFAPDVAMQVLKTAGLEMSNGNIGSDCTVSSQTPLAGSLVRAGSGVLVAISCSPSNVGQPGGGSTYTNGNGGSTYTNGDGGSSYSNGGGGSSSYSNGDSSSSYSNGGGGSSYSNGDGGSSYSNGDGGSSYSNGGGGSSYTNGDGSSSYSNGGGGN